MTAAGSGLGWPGRALVMAAESDANLAAAGIGWPGEVANSRASALKPDGLSGTSGCGRWPGGRGLDQGGMAVARAVVRGTGGALSGLGWPAAASTPRGSGGSSWHGAGEPGKGHGLGWPAEARERRADTQVGAFGVSRETWATERAAASAASSPELFGGPDLEVTAPAEVRGGQDGGGHGWDLGTEGQCGWAEIQPVAADQSGAWQGAGRDETEPGSGSSGAPGSADAGAASGDSGMVGDDRNGARRHENGERRGEPDWFAGSAAMQARWQQWLPVVPRHGRPLGWLRSETGECAGEKARQYGASAVETESSSAKASTQGPVVGAWHPQSQPGPMIAGTYSRALGAQDESEDEVSIPAVPDTSADTPIARAAEAAMNARTSSEQWPRPGSCRILTIANQKGGVGKTTTAVNLAAGLAMHGSRVLVVDLDPQGNASTALDVEHRSGITSIYNVLVDGLPLAEAVRPVEGFPLLHCAPATIDLAGAEIELVPLVARESRLGRAVSEYDASNLDYIFIDCPPSLGLLTVNALVAAPEVLIPIQCEYYALEGLEQLLRTIELVKSHLNPGLRVTTILLTMFDSRTRLASQVADEVRGHFGDLVLHSVIPRSVRVSEAPSYGQSVMTYDPGSSGALAYLEAAKEVAFSNTKAAAS